MRPRPRLRRRAIVRATPRTSTNASTRITTATAAVMANPVQLKSDASTPEA